MENVRNKELNSLTSLYRRLQTLKLKVVENIGALAKVKDDNNDNLVGYELLMKEYYIRNSSRHVKDAENSLILANEAEKLRNKSGVDWGEL